mgnify:CR=1 FL=1
MRIILFTILVYLYGFSLLSQDLPLPAEQDTVGTRTVKLDSTHQHRLQPSQKHTKSLNIDMPEYMVKRNLARLSYYAQGRYLNSYYALEELFFQANMFPEDVKNRMFALTLGGGVAREVFRVSRHYLGKYKLGFIYPNLNGLNISYPLRQFGLNASFYFRTQSLTDRYYGLRMLKNRVFLAFRESDRYTQNALYVRVAKPLQLFTTYTQYDRTSYTGLGFSYRTPNVLVYSTFLRHSHTPKYNRFTIFMNINFD